MAGPVTRRSFLAAAPTLCATTALLLSGRGAATAGEPAVSPALPDTFPAQDPARVKEMVGVSHGNAVRVRELLGESPALAKAAWDWGFGDWETALGAASHVGNREIAELLMDHGARPDLFTFAMMGRLEVVRACVAAQPGIQKIPGPHGLTLMHHARQGGPPAQAVVEFLEAVGDADLKPQSQPIAEDAMMACVGAYATGPAPGLTLAISLKDGVLWFKRLPDGSGRSLVHLGGHVFHPVGAAAVRIRFEGTGTATTGLVVTDGPVTITAQRQAG